MKKFKNVKTFYIYAVNAVGNAFDRICLCLSVCRVGALTFESLDVGTSFLFNWYILRIYGSR